jgi:rhodanese-related sulfurtransferase
LELQAMYAMAQTITSIRPIGKDELKAKIDRRDPFVLIETLAPEHFEHAHLPRAVNAPPERIEELAPSLAPDKNAEIVTYCASEQCHASADAAQKLIAQGYTNVRHYAGGKKDWIAAGFPIEHGKP